jgi:hypothetical protein
MLNLLDYGLMIKGITFSNNIFFKHMLQNSWVQLSLQNESVEQISQ